MRPFPVSIKVGYRIYHLMVERTEAGTTVERFRVSPRNNPSKYVTLVSNRPALRGKYGLKHKPPLWTMVEGNSWSQSAFDDLISKIMEHIEPPLG